MDIQFMNEKIEEWEIEHQNCSSRTLKVLLDELITVGKTNLSNYKTVTLLLKENDMKFKNTVINLDERIKNGGNLRSFNNYKFIEKDNELFKSRVKILKNNVQTKELLNKFEKMSIDELNDFFDNVLIKAEKHNSMMQQTISNSLKIEKNTLESLFSFDKILTEQYTILIEEAFNCFDYGKFQNIKQAIIDVIKDLASINKCIDLTIALAELVNLLDEHKNKEKFYTTTDNNVLKFEQQIEALEISKDFGIILINILKIDKYNLPELDDNDIDKILIDYHNNVIERQN